MTAGFVMWLLGFLAQVVLGGIGIGIALYKILTNHLDHMEGRFVKRMDQLQDDVREIRQAVLTCKCH